MLVPWCGGDCGSLAIKRGTDLGFGDLLDPNDAKAVFAVLDMDGSGFVDFTEIEQVLEALGVPFRSLQEATEAFDALDRGKNGRIREHEFVDWWDSAKADDVLRQRLHDTLMSNVEKLRDARGVLFG